MHKLLAVLAFAAMSGAAQAEVTEDDEALVRCQVDFDFAFELITAPGPDETDDEAIARIDPEMAEFASILHDYSDDASLRIVTLTHLTGPDSRRVDIIEQAEEDEINDLLDAAASEAEFEKVLELVMDRTFTCIDRFYPEG